MKKYLLITILIFNSFIVLSQLNENTVMGIPIGTTVDINSVTPLEQGALAFNTDTKRLMVFDGISWVNTSSSNSQNWTLTGNSGTATANFLGTIDDRIMQIRSNNTAMLEFGRRQTLGLTDSYPDYTDNNQSLVYVRGNGVTSALQFAANGASFYKPMFFTTTNGSFRLKGSAGGTDLFEIGSAGPANAGRLEFIIGDDGAEPIIFKRYNYYDTTHKELFRVQGSSNASDAKPRFGININPVGVAIDGTYNGSDTGNIANSTFQVNGSVSNSILTTTGNITLTEDHHSIILGGSHTIALPAANSCIGRVYVIKNRNATPTTISAYQNNLGATIGIINSNTVLTIQSDGANWQQITNAAGSTVFQTLSQTGLNVTLSNGGGSISVADNDNDASNEIQTISKTGLNVTLSNGGGSISVADNDNDASNEIQTISRTGLNVMLSTGGGSVSVADNDNDPTNENQTVSAGTGISVSQTGQNFAITNSAPDQIVTITGSGATIVSGTYPNFTVSSPALTPGDIKHGIQPGNHNGWYLLDGSPISNLPANAQTNAASIGLTGNLPNASDRVLKHPNGAQTIGNTGGQQNTILTQNNLPNVNFTGNTNTTGNHNHTISGTSRSATTNGLFASNGINYFDVSGSGTSTTSNGGNHSHNVTVSSGGSGESFERYQPYLVVNTFIYLGL